MKFRKKVSFIFFYENKCRIKEKLAISNISIQCIFSNAKTKSLVNKIIVLIQVIQEEALTSIKFFFFYFRPNSWSAW